MSLTAGYTKDCTTPRIGGVKEIHIIAVDDLTSFTGAAGAYTAVTPVATKFFRKFEFEQDVAEFRENGEGTLTGAHQYTHEIEFVEAGTSALLINAITELVNCSCGVVVIVTLASGVDVVLGYSEGFTTDRPMHFLSDTTTSGQAILDAGISTIVLQSIDSDKAWTFTGTIPIS